MTNARPILAKRDERKKIIQAIQEDRKSKVICYITAERKTFGAGMGSDTIPLFFDHLCSIKKCEKIDIFLYTRGGYTLTPNRLVYLFREFCEKLAILIPFRAHSAGTTLALGADEIVMGPMGELGPVDPSVSNIFNPKQEENKNKKKKEPIPISVEDVSAYLKLVQDKLSQEPTVLANTLEALTDKVHPLALGNVHRQYLLIRTMSKRLLSLHLKPEEDKEKIEKIIDILTEKLYFHGYEISRYEAKEIVGLNVIYPSEKIEKLMWELYENYQDTITMGKEIDFNTVLGNQDQRNFLIESAIIESENILHAFIYEGSVKRKRPGKPEFDINITRIDWEKHS